MNHYSELIYKIEELGQPLVSTITSGNFEDIDISKANIYPLLHIFVSGGGFTNGSTVLLSVQLGCFQQRINNSELNTDKLLRNDNRVDNMNETLSTLNTIWTKLYTDFEQNNITASENPTLEPVENGYENGLDGWILTFDLEMPNQRLNLCQ